MEARPVTAFLVTALILWAVYLWRSGRLGVSGILPHPMDVIRGQPDPVKGPVSQVVPILPFIPPNGWKVVG